MEIEIMKAGKGYFRDKNESLIYCNAFGKESSFTIKQTFEFNSVAQRMSVLAINQETQESFIYCKGNPEKIKELCILSTIPHNFDEHLNFLTMSGYRVLAVASKSIEIRKGRILSREDAEAELNFIGLIVLENKLKVKTKEVIQRFNDAHIQSIMITGDNLNTAVAIARHCDIIHEQHNVFRIDNKDEIEFVEITDYEKMLHHKDDSDDESSHYSEKIAPIKEQEEKKVPDSVCYVITGDVLEEILIKYNYDIQNATISDIIHKCRVYARTTPQQKRDIVDLIKQVKSIETDTLVGYCGDGANDTMALKEADVGISLSVEEASLAAPFIATQTEITCVERVLIEGRGALNCTFQNLKFFLFYCLSQTMGVMALSCYVVNFSDFAFLWMDIVIALPLTAFLAQIPTAKALFPRLPPNTLLALSVILSFFLQLFFSFVVLLISLSSLPVLDSLYVPASKTRSLNPDTRIDLLSYSQQLVCLIC